MDADLLRGAARHLPLLAGTYDETSVLDDRAPFADSRLGRFSDEGLLIDRPLPESMLTPGLTCASWSWTSEMPLTVARGSLLGAGHGCS